jgi:hypothetical protein
VYDDIKAQPPVVLNSVFGSSSQFIISLAHRIIESAVQRENCTKSEDEYCKTAKPPIPTQCMICQRPGLFNLDRFTITDSDIIQGLLVTVNQVDLDSELEIYLQGLKYWLGIRMKKSSKAFESTALVDKIAQNNRLIMQLITSLGERKMEDHPVLRRLFAIEPKEPFFKTLREMPYLQFDPVTLQSILAHIISRNWLSFVADPAIVPRDLQFLLYGQLYKHCLTVGISEAECKILLVSPS